MTISGQSKADRLRNQIVEVAREFTEAIDPSDRAKTEMAAYRFAGRFEALLGFFDRAATDADS